MTTQKLQQAKVLDHKIHNQKELVSRLKKTLKSISLTDTSFIDGCDTEKIYIDVSGNGTYVDKDRLIDFLNHELAASEKELKEFQKQFDEL